MSEDGLQVHKGLKSAVFAVLLIAAGYLFGYVCQQTQQGYELLFNPSAKDAIRLVLWLLAALGATALTAGLVAALLRPLWVCFLVFALSALAMLLGWGLKASAGVLTTVYFIASLIYVQGIASELNSRLGFSVRPIWHSQSILLTALVIVVCGSFYFGYAAEIRREGFSIPPFLFKMITGRVEKEIGKLLPEVEWEADIAKFRGQLEGTLGEMAGEVGRLLPETVREAAMAKFREQLERALDEMAKEAGRRLQTVEREAVIAKFMDQFEQALKGLVEEAIRPYQRWIPLVLSINLFMFLLTVTGLLSWIPILVLMVIFPLLTALGVTKVVIEMHEVKKLTLD